MVPCKSKLIYDAVFILLDPLASTVLLQLAVIFKSHKGWLLFLKSWDYLSDWLDQENGMGGWSLQMG